MATPSAAGLPRLGHLDLAEGGAIEVLATPAHCALTILQPGGQVATVRLDRPALTWLRVMLGLAFGQIAARRFARSA